MEIFEGDLPAHIDLGKEIAIDTEAMGLKPRRDRLCLVQIADSNGNIYFVHFKKGQYKAPNLVKILNDQKVCKIFHYARFDLTTMMYYLPGCEPKNIFCTKVSSLLIRTYTERHGLKSLVKEVLGIEMEKTEQSSYWGADVLTEKQKEYAATDVKYLHKLKTELTKRLKKEDRYDLAKECFKFLTTQARLDLLFTEEVDIFAHNTSRR